MTILCMRPDECESAIQDGPQILLRGATRAIFPEDEQTLQEGIEAVDFQGNQGSGFLHGRLAFEAPSQ
jgi:hypothetical protein